MLLIWGKCLMLLIELNISNFNTQNVKYMDRMFKNCKLIKNLNLTHLILKMLLI